jgi:hypothetical protein
MSPFNKMANSERPLRAVLFLSLLLLAVMTWGVVWQARVIQEQKALIRQLSGFTFVEQ